MFVVVKRIRGWFKSLSSIILNNAFLKRTLALARKNVFKFMYFIFFFRSI